jgi:hypothetical protein
MQYLKKRASLHLSMRKPKKCPHDERNRTDGMKKKKERDETRKNPRN